MTECAIDPSSLPAVTWPDLLLFAPYFSSGLPDAVEAAGIDWPDLARWPRALLYWDSLAGEIANGGVVQYFYNHGGAAPAFSLIPEFIGQHPLLAPHSPLVGQAFSLWPEIAPADNGRRRCSSVMKAGLMSWRRRSPNLKNALRRRLTITC